LYFCSTSWSSTRKLNWRWGDNAASGSYSKNSPFRLNLRSSKVKKVSPWDGYANCDLRKMP
jgi:hypothetical protein